MEQNNPINNTHANALLYAKVILPIKFTGEITYYIPAIYTVTIGMRVIVDFAGKLYSGIVKEITETTKQDHQQGEGEEQSQEQTQKKEITYKPILSLENNLPLVTKEEITFWEHIANYYMCSVGEVFKAAYSSTTIKQEGVKPRKTVALFIENIGNELNITRPILSPAQEIAYTAIQQTFYQPQNNNSNRNINNKNPKPALLKGVTGSGKTEIYINLAITEIEKGNNVLYMVPEIALSKQLFQRLKKVFGERLLTFHSKQTAAEKSRILRILTDKSSESNKSVIILGTRSALFLPYPNLGMVIIDEEHDTSYKQTEPAPRYHARDAAIMLSGIHKANILMGSATPSFESEYNCEIGRFTKIELNEKYYGAVPPSVDIIDTIYARKSGQMVGSFSQKLINEIRKTINNGWQVLIFRNRRSYSPIVECTECGTIPKCPHCNVYLSYHKYNNTLRCHHCEYIARFNGICLKCGLDTVKYKGAGTEKLEEELKSIFPDINISRYDADIAKSKKEEEKVIKEFAQGHTNILIGTQMISKGFDFEKLNLVAVMQADTILGIQDFRADERAMQLFNQLMGRTGRRTERGKLIIQTNQREHPVLECLKDNQRITSKPNNLVSELLLERKEFNFAPYVRMVKIIVKHSDPEKLNSICAKVEEALKKEKGNYREITGPFTPTIDKIRGEYIKCFYVKFARDNKLTINKERLQELINNTKAARFILIDVDPLN